MHLTNTFKDELTSSLKQYSLMNSLQIAIFFAFYTFHVVVHHNFFSITGTLTNSKGHDEMAIMRYFTRVCTVCNNENNLQG